ncbi:hypothetical protein IFM89_032570 [Coptis chinensis]|uniref:RRM domain-containing protein n=1 Tax=Coptis chinensis TaxID=261450 RepID=A0A835ISM5_9MAGN|nr:hypothetical protein IFM89_032570 [Coptis chinensis]
MSNTTNNNGVADQQQQWMAAAMQYPGMMMPHHHHMNMNMNVMTPSHYPAPHYLPFIHQQQLQLQQLQLQQQGGGEGVTEENRKSIWVGDLHYWMDENYLHTCFGHTGEVTSIKVIRNKQTGQSEGYGFVEFYSHAAAEKILQTYNGAPMLSSEQPFRLNWASNSMGDKRSDVGTDRSIFVGDLAADVTDTLLQETFASKYSSVKGAKVVIDATTGRSKGYGFVRFGDDNERSQAMTEMNGQYCSSRQMRIGLATPRKSSGYQQQHSSQGMY